MTHIFAPSPATSPDEREHPSQTDEFLRRARQTDAQQAGGGYR
ncbi:hypothetical protein [Streptomyces sp. x-19]